ncbi:MAG: hypothetical protein ACLVJH_07850 [Faecalibacterium prausnitzii]
MLLCPFCADVCWAERHAYRKGRCTGHHLAGVPVPEAGTSRRSRRSRKGFTGRLKAKFRAWRAERKRKKAEKGCAAAAAKLKAARRAKGKDHAGYALHHAAGRGYADAGGVRRAAHHKDLRSALACAGDDPAAAARSYGKLQAWLYPTLGVLDRFLFLEFDELRILPDFGSAAAHCAGPGVLPGQRTGAVHRSSLRCGYCTSSGAKKYWTFSFE